MFVNHTDSDSTIARVKISQNIDTCQGISDALKSQTLSNLTCTCSTSSCGDRSPTTSLLQLLSLTDGSRAALVSTTVR